MIPANEIVQALKPVADALNNLGIPYYIGGSVASSTYGVARSTLDVDMVSSFNYEHIPKFIPLIEDQYYVNKELIEDAIKRSSSFNLIHLATGLKIDIFIQKNRPHAREAARRIRQETITNEADAPRFYLASPEDVILAKLEWSKLGGQTSEKQWGDILGILRVQENHLDMGYLEKWAENLKVNEILTKILNEK